MFLDLLNPPNQVNSFNLVMPAFVERPLPPSQPQTSSSHFSITKPACQGRIVHIIFFLTNACREHLHISLLRYMADIGKAWPVLILYGGLLPLFLSVLWLLMIRHFVGVMPWITVALFNILIITVMMFYYLKAGWIGSDAISPIIGDHDPYIHVSGRMGTKSSSCCCDSHDICCGSFC